MVLGAEPRGARAACCGQRVFNTTSAALVCIVWDTGCGYDTVCRNGLCVATARYTVGFPADASIGEITCHWIVGIARNVTAGV